MTYFPDLTPCTYFGEGEHGTAFVAVAWLERGHEYARGSVAAAVFRRLADFRAHAWEPFNCFGFHNCDLCEDSPRPTAGAEFIPFKEWRKDGHQQGTMDHDGLSCKNLYVPSGRKIYVAPEMILHYVRIHEYRPPGQFCDALVTCPDMGSDAYFTAMSSTTWADIERRSAPPGRDFDQMMAHEVELYREWRAKS